MSYQNVRNHVFKENTGLAWFPLKCVLHSAHESVEPRYNIQVQFKSI